MPRSNAAKGAYFKGRTKKYYRGDYQVIDLEIMRQAWKDGAPSHFVKKDQCGADLMLMSATEVVFVGHV